MNNHKQRSSLTKQRQRMRTESLLLVVTLLLTTTCHAHVINKRRQPIPILLKMDEITRHLRDLTTSMADFDMELRGALSADPVASSRLLKRSASDDDDKISCRLSLREDLCQALEMMKERERSNYLVSPKSPGKRAGDNSPAKYQ
ncbi:uncharacterized protein, partial [Littorina saxatilis]|uniref:uncharacterized protein n=1 Tax=Littorina saxatilis TaxID=31220 RepID=UPI0038B5DE13